MRLFGLIGYPLGHSWSEKYFTDKFSAGGMIDAEYKLYPIKDIDEFGTLLQRYKFSGLNVTVPYKQSVIPFLDEIDDVAKAVGAVNTIKFYAVNNKIITKGYNTDIYGFECLLNKFVLLPGIKALILGTGGSSKAVAYVLNRKNIRFHFVSRSPSGKNIFSYGDLDEKVIAGHKIIINTTPCGMYPDAGKSPGIPYEFISGGHICIDLIYNPEKTLFLQRCEEHNASVINGLEMLNMQAEQSWKIWNE